MYVSNIKLNFIILLNLKYEILAVFLNINIYINSCIPKNKYDLHQFI